MRIRVPQVRTRRVVVGLDKALNPVSARIRWMEGGEVVRYIGLAVAPFVTFEELLVELDRLPRHISFRDLDELTFCARGWVEPAASSVAFDMPGWYLTGMAGATEWREQPELPF